MVFCAVSCQASVELLAPTNGAVIALVPDAQKKVLALPTTEDRLQFFSYTTPEKLAKEKITDENRPDAIIYDFNELKELFPAAPHVAWDKIRRV